MSLTKADLIHSIYNDLNIPKGTSVTIVESLLEIMKKTLESGEDIMISGFGKFSVKEKRERRGRDPATGEDKTLRARKVVVFKWSRSLKERVNGERT